jgi:hypothetical protein
MKPIVAAAVVLSALLANNVGGKSNGKVVLTREMLLQAVTAARKGDHLPLQVMQRAFGRSDRFIIPKDLLPVYVDLLKEEDPRVQRLGISGIVYFKATQSQAALVDYLKAKNPRQLQERFENATKDEQEKNDREYSERMLNAAIAVWALGEVGDTSVIPLLESLRGIKEMQMEWVGNPVEKSIQRIKARQSASDPPVKGPQEQRTSNTRLPPTRMRR